MPESELVHRKIKFTCPEGSSNNRTTINVAPWCCAQFLENRWYVLTGDLDADATTEIPVEVLLGGGPAGLKSPITVKSPSESAVLTTVVRSLNGKQKQDKSSNYIHGI